MSTPSENLIAQINQAKADLAERLNKSVTEIDLRKTEMKSWRDGSLGCPQPGMMYTQALVDGYIITLQVDGSIYHYHGQMGRTPFLCEEPASNK